MAVPSGPAAALTAVLIKAATPPARALAYHRARRRAAPARGQRRRAAWEPRARAALAASPSAAAAVNPRSPVGVGRLARAHIPEAFTRAFNHTQELAHALVPQAHVRTLTTCARAPRAPSIRWARARTAINPGARPATRPLSSAKT